jgi:hypothetical protein
VKSSVVGPDTPSAFVSVALHPVAAAVALYVPSGIRSNE